MSNYFSMEAFDYDDIQLIPNKGIIKSRRDADTSVKFGNRTFKIPVVPANMESVIDDKLAVWLAENDYYYVMHRFEPEKRIPFIKMMHEKGLFASISVGIKDSEYDFIDELVKQNLKPEYITIDVAHGHSVYVIKMIKYIKEKLPNSFLTAGNIATPEAVRELENAGADATKVGVGPGKACITKLKTGFWYRGWQLAALRMCSKIASKTPLLQMAVFVITVILLNLFDFGASMVMIGSMLAGHEESPGNVIKIDGKPLNNIGDPLLKYKKVLTRTLKVNKCLFHIAAQLKILYVKCKKICNLLFLMPVDVN